MYTQTNMYTEREMYKHIGTIHTNSTHTIHIHNAHRTHTHTHTRVYFVITEFTVARFSFCNRVLKSAAPFYFHCSSNNRNATSSC